MNWTAMAGTALLFALGLLLFSMETAGIVATGRVDTLWGVLIGGGGVGAVWVARDGTRKS